MKMTDSPPVGAADRTTWGLQLCVSAQEVFEIMLGTKLVRYFDSEPVSVAEFTAMVGIAGALCGVFTIRCSEYAASAIASKMLGTSIEDASQEKWDAMGEVCNMWRAASRPSLRAAEKTVCFRSQP